MKLCYRGVSYRRNSSSLPESDSEIVGKYRSQPWQKKKFEITLKPLSSLYQLLKLRGQVYEKVRFEAINLQVQVKVKEARETVALAS